MNQGEPDVTVDNKELSGSLAPHADVADAAPVKPRATSRRLPQRLSRILSLEDLEAAGRRHLPRPIFGFISGGVETNATLRANRAAFQDWAFLPRMLVDTAARSQAAMLMGKGYAAPFGIAPMGLSAMAAYRGDMVLAETAAAAGIPMIMSGASLISVEEIARAAPGTWFQAYLPGEPRRISALVERVARAGLETLVLTVDVPVSANRENNVRNGFSTPLRPTLRLAWDGLVRPAWLLGTLGRTLLTQGMPHFENMTAQRGAPVFSSRVDRDFGPRDSLAWEHLALMRRLWKGRLVVKGILSPDDARMAREHGADGIIVSNHGGRQLDGAIASLRALPGIAAVAGGMAVMLDSGVRRGTDVLKALALGAQFVFLGRPFLYAAAIGGEAGVNRAIELLRQEIDRDMAQLGITSLAQMTPELLVGATSRG